MFIPAFIWKTDKLTDISYAVTFVIVALYGFLFGGITTASVVLFSMITLWAVRLGSYLLVRIHKIGKDNRFDEMREHFWRFFRFWLLQGVSVWVVLLPSMLFFHNSIQTIPPYAYIGLLLWLTGLTIEAVADMQKFRFINDPQNKGKWIDSGLWKYSRHPNYFGEILLWAGVYIFTLFGLGVVESWIGAIGPLYIASLILFVSGIPLLEKGAEERWGDQDAYQAYKKKTSILIPWFTK